MPNGRCDDQAVLSNFRVAGLITFGDGSVTFEILRRNEHFRKRISSDNQKLYVPWLSYDFRQCRQDGLIFELLDLHDFDLFGDWDLRD